MQSSNPFKAAIEARRRQVGLWLSLANPYAAEICATAGFDWVLIDGEHAPNDVPSILRQLQSIAGHKTQAVVRPPIAEASLIKQYLDIGVRNLLVPMVDSAEQARALVGAVRYPPAGIRGVGSRMARASGFGLDTGYLRSADQGICLIAQIESRAGLANLEAIAAVEGIDGLFVGPSDLAAALGHTGRPDHADVRAAVDDALRRIAAAGKPSGIVSYDGQGTQHYLESGTTFVAVGGDVAVLAQGARALSARFAQARGTKLSTKDIA
jgi:4-hydroxy-2-oxoheptanedioate aldolase